MVPLVFADASYASEISTQRSISGNGYKLTGDS